MVNEWVCEIVRWDNIMISEVGEKTPQTECINGKRVTMISNRIPNG